MVALDESNMVASDESNNSAKLPCLVADAAAFLRNVDLQNISEKIFTIKEVIHEIRDSATKQRLAVLPYELNFREPSAESFQAIVAFSKKTGDYKSLSAVDLKVLALTHQLEKEFCNVEHINAEPSKKTLVVHKSKVRADKEIAGFYLEPKVGNENGKENEKTEDSVEIEGAGSDDVEMGNEDKGKVEESTDDNKCMETVDSEEHKNNFIDSDSPNDNSDDKEDGDDDDDAADDDEDDDAGWITPGNIKEVKQTFGMADEIKIEEGHIKCACLTTDFAMQNVLIQMGMHVVSVSGMLIRQARNYIQKCFGCYKETHDMTRLFCPSCGNKTLKKVSVTIGEDGTMQYHYPKRQRNHNIRGTKFSIPAPKQGRHQTSVLLCEDQPMGQIRMPRSRDKANPMDPDYAARTNPFAVNDVNSRAFYLGLHVKQKQARNPNETKKKKSGRKK